MTTSRLNVVTIKSFCAKQAKERKIDARKFLAEAKKFARMMARGDRDGADALRVMDVMVREEHFVKELKHLPFNWDKHPHSKHVGLGT